MDNFFENFLTDHDGSQNLVIFRITNGYFSVRSTGKFFPVGRKSHISVSTSAFIEVFEFVSRLRVPDFDRCRAPAYEASTVGKECKAVGLFGSYKGL